MNKQLGVIVPYFGSLPKTFKVWAKSIKMNPNVTFFLISDQKNLKFHYDNLVVIYMSFEDLQIKLKSMLNINLKSPYKLCDLKPAYGYIFSNILEGFEYWGYSDLDLVFGNLDDVLLKVNNRSHHKLFINGHFSIYKNIVDINNLFKTTKHNNKWDYIKNSRIIWVFDENYFGDITGINGLLLNENKSVFNDISLYSDVNPIRLGFFNLNISNHTNNFYYLTDSNLIEISYDPILKNFYEKKLVYVHFQKRQVRINYIADGLIIIYPFHWKLINSLEDCKKALQDNYKQDFELNKKNFKNNFKRKKLKLLYLILEISNFDLIIILFAKILKTTQNIFKKN